MCVGPQNIVRDSFKTCTVLTIAHRLHTVIDNDRVAVLDQGKVLSVRPCLQLQPAHASELVARETPEPSGHHT
eukprot:scaffold260_cov328-Prasinococcus_capsulatus_cf.AAC.18